MFFDIFDLKAVRANPLLASEFIQLVQPMELANYAKSIDADGDSVLAERCVIEGLLASNSAALKLVLATYGRWQHFLSNDSADAQVCALLDMGPAYKAAIFGNPLIDWYAGRIFGGGYFKVALKCLCATNDEDKYATALVSVIARNPRFDREVLADAIRGAKHFSSLPLARRVLLAEGCIDVKEIRSPNFPGKDSPDNNELKFRKPFAAVAELARFAFTDGGAEQYAAVAHRIMWKLPGASLSLEPSSWLSNPEPYVFESGGLSTWSETSARNAVAAFRALMAFVKSVHSPRQQGQPNDEAGQKDEDEISAFTVLLLQGVLRDYSFADVRDDVCVEMLESECWQIRAAAYSTVFESLRVDPKYADVKRFFEFFPEDVFERSYGVLCTQAAALHLTVGVGSELRRQLTSTKDSERLVAVSDSLFQYLFGGPYRNTEEDEEAAKQWDRQRSGSSAGITLAERVRAKRTPSGKRSAHVADSSEQASKTNIGEGNSRPGGKSFRFWRS